VIRQYRPVISDIRHAPVECVAYTKRLANEQLVPSNSNPMQRTGVVNHWRVSQNAIDFFPTRRFCRR